MADAHAPERPLANGQTRIDFQTEPSRYRHWKLKIDGDVATLLLDVDEKGSLFEGYDLKLNSYDLGVDIELADVIERLRFEHPQVRVVVLRSGKPRVFCAGANIRMLAGASHAHKVNFCKFTNETRNGIEDLSENSGLQTICAINGTAAGGGYSRWRPTTSCWWTTAPRRFRCRNCRCSRFCPALEGSLASPTSARCAATTPTFSAPPRKA
jgi:benzoyl-CoA-dihydrodiol lyase